MKIAVVGAGIMGVASAFCIKMTYPQFDVVVLAKDFSPNTTSDGAAGFWEPIYAGGTPEKLLHKWSKVTYDYVMDLIKNDPTSAEAGLTTTHGYNLSTNEIPEVPYWSDIPYDFDVLSKQDLQRFPGYAKSGIKFTTVFLEGSKIIPWLSKKFVDKGGKFIQREVHCFDELSEEFHIVVNCTGLGAEKLLNDDQIFPIRGQVMHVKAPWVKEFVVMEHLEKNTVSYILPNQNDIVLGGTAYVDDRNVNVEAKDKEHILTTCQEILPSLKYAEYVSDWVGLRPARKEVRLEKEDRVVNHDGVTKVLKVVHNYGHGGSGLTVHRGCALDVLELVTECLTELHAFKSML